MALSLLINALSFAGPAARLAAPAARLAAVKPTVESRVEEPKMYMGMMGYDRYSAVDRAYSRGRPWGNGGG